MKIPEETMREMRDVSESYVVAMRAVKASLAGWCLRGARIGIYQEFCLQLHAVRGASDLVSAVDPQQAGAQLYDLFCSQVQREAQEMVEAVIEDGQGGA